MLANRHGLTLCALLVGLPLFGLSQGADAQVLLEMTDEPGLRRCFEQHMLHVPGFEREWVAELLLGPDGSVVELLSVTPAITGEGLRECIHDALAALSFPVPAGSATAVLAYSFFYRARSARDLAISEDAPLTERVVATLGAHEGQTTACFEQAATALGEYTRVVARITVGLDGQIKQVDFPDSNAGGRVEPCLEAALSEIVFPISPDSRPYAFNYPMSYSLWGSASPPRERRGRRVDSGDYAHDVEFEIDFDVDFEFD